MAVVLVTSGAAPPPEEEPPRCHGRRAKIVGTDESEVLRGTSSRDVIWGAGGDDTIIGSLGNDLICGATGSDLIHGGRGNDVVDGGAGDEDRIVGDLGDDRVLGGPGRFDEVAGSLGIDVLSGGRGGFDLVHGDYGYDRMDGGAGGGDIASFATDVGAPKERGVWASLRTHRARGDGHDRLFRFESLEGSAFEDTLIGNKQINAIDGGPGNDMIIGGGGADVIEGGQGRDGCKGAKGRTTSCGKEKRLKASAYIEIDSTLGGGGGLVIAGKGGDDDFTVAYDEAANRFSITGKKGIGVGPGCTHVSPTQVGCKVGGPARWLTADLGPGNDRFRVEGSLSGVENVRIAGSLGNDVMRGGPEDDLIEAGFGADRLYGEAGSDGLIGSTPGPTSLYGGEHGDLLAAGGGCAGGEIVGGPGRDDASFAETQAHPGTLFVSFPRGMAWIDAVRGCDPVKLSDTNEDMEGSFDNDVLIGDSRRNAMLGQPGRDRFYGNGGDDVVDARDGVRDFFIQCGAGRYVRPPRPKGAKSPPPPVLRGAPAGRALTDSFDPGPVLCEVSKHGRPVPGLNHSG
jgi:Ca2+-binding RTX toxin-like protein